MFTQNLNLYYCLADKLSVFYFLLCMRSEETDYPLLMFETIVVLNNKLIIRYLLKEQQNLDEIVTNINSTLEFLNFQPPSRTKTVWPRILQSAAGYMLVQSIVIMFFGWKQWNFPSRVAAMENLTYAFGAFSICTDVFLMSDRTYELITMIKAKYYLFKTNLNKAPNQNVFEKKINLINKMEQAMYEGAISIEKILKCLFIGYMTLPAVSIAFYFANLSKIETLRLPFIIYVPYFYPLSLTFTSIQQYLISTLLNIIWLIYSAVVSIAVFKIMMLSVNNVLTEMKLFRMNFEELDLCFNSNVNIKQSCDKHVKMEFESSQECDPETVMRHIVIHHQIIFRKVGILNSGLKFRLFYFNTFSCLQICLSIFSFMRGEFTLKIKHGIVIIGVVLNCFFICDLGQKLQDEGERIRADLIYGCDWMNKPNWLNRLLLIMMIQNNKLPKLGLFNVFTLNRNNLRVIVQGAYSYLNLLNNISK